ncbi:MAG: ABC transporter substrate-binding protein [Candidatus Altimarinota bacterium]
MKKFFKVFLNVIRSYSLEERVISLVLIFALLFSGVKSVQYIINPYSVFADSGFYTEAHLATKPVLLNPVYNDLALANREISASIFTGLMRYDSKVKSFVDDLGKLTISEDKKEYVFKIKEGVLWHDGTPFTVDDVVFTYKDVIQNPLFQNPVVKANFVGVIVEKVDDQTMKFVLERPNSFFITNLNIGILPKHLLAEVGVESLPAAEFNMNPIGTGPYKVDSPLEIFDTGEQRVTLVVNNDYYGAKSKINRIRFMIFPDETALVKQRAAINIVPRAVSSMDELLNDQRFSISTYSLPQYTGVFFNTKDPVLKNQKLRLGLIKSIDKDSLIGSIENKERIDTPLMELSQEEWINKPDQKEAAGAFFDAGYGFKKDDAGNVIEGEKYRKDKDDKELEIVMVARQYDDGSYLAVETQQTTDFLIKAWEANGVKVTLRLLPESEYVEAIKNKDYQMILAGQTMAYNLDTFPYWHSSQAKVGGLNLSNYQSFAADQQIEKIRETFDEEDRTERRVNLAETISADAPALFLYRPKYLFASDGKVKNISLENLSFASDRFGNEADWCIKNC